MDRLKQFFSDPWKAATTALSLALVVVLAIFFTGDDPVDVDGSSSTTTTKPDDTSTTEPEAPGAPGAGLVGLAGVKVDNAPLARPQVGIGAVPLLVEYMTEGGITRFVAVVDASATGVLGPVRSLRPVDADLFPLLAPTLASTGGQSFVIREVDAGGTVRTEPGSLGGFMTANRPPPHDIFVDIESLLAEGPGFNPADPAFPAGSLPGGVSADHATVTEWNLGWSFGDDVYSRTQNGEPFLVQEEIDGDLVELTHDVLLFIQVGQRSAGYTDGAGAPVFTFDVIGGGDMVAFHDGQATAGSWMRRSHAEGYQLFDENGDQVGLPTGRVYVAFLPQGIDVEY